MADLLWPGWLWLGLRWPGLRWPGLLWPGLLLLGLLWPGVGAASEPSRPAPPTADEMRPVEGPGSAHRHQRADRPAPAPGSSLSPRDRELYLIGPISRTEWIVGGLVGSFFGFGIGHAVQGRYASDGWVFTAGEGGMAAAMLISLPRCIVSDGGRPCLVTAGAYIGLLGIRIWELVDVWGGPHWHNERLKVLGHPRSARADANSRYSQVSRRRHTRRTWSLALLPTPRGGVLGLSAAF